MENDAMSMYWFSAVRVAALATGDVRIWPGGVQLSVNPDGQIGERSMSLVFACMDKEWGYILLA